jgi:Fe-S-cluster containining protein
LTINPIFRLENGELKLLLDQEGDRQKNFFDVCSRCRTNYSCCHDTTPPITEERRRIIEDYLKQNGSDFENTFDQTDYVFPRLKADGYCVFQHGKSRRCLIHAVKPETCVAGPITFDVNVTTGKIEWFIKKESLCQLAGIVYRDKKLLNKHLASAKKEINHLVLRLPISELKAILKKDEPETFKIGEDQLDEKVLRNLRN